MKQEHMQSAVHRNGAENPVNLSEVASLGVPQSVELDVAGRTDRGHQRAQNEDTFLIARIQRALDIVESSYQTLPAVWRTGRDQGYLLLVADGMGGHEDGEVASAVSTAAVANYLAYVMPWILPHPQTRESLPGVRQHLLAAVAAGEAGIRDTVQRGQASPHMGTTLTLALVLWPRAYVAHVGDTRLYLWRAGRLHQTTQDHTLQAELERRGDFPQATPEMAHILTNAVGGAQGATPDVLRLDLERGDQLLLCSDGLIRHVADARICEILSGASSATACCDQLIAEALAGGGSDNVSVIVARV